ncbi:MAG: sigma-70 family RNA polymerase sigma factor [Deltaproteobacteria bacterium]|nr:sigma-70 family RNA polymerase sigma factor [Deltaproteobacteria bacterium]
MEIDVDALIMENQGLVREVVRQVTVEYQCHNIQEELMEYGILGLCEAANSFDPQRGRAFSSFAWLRIRGAVMDGILQTKGIKRSVVRRARAHRAATEMEENEPVPGEHAMSVFEEYDEVSNLVADMGTCYLVGAQFESGKRPDNPEKEYLTKETLEVIGDAMEVLKQDEYKLLRMHYGMDLPLSHVAVELGVTRPWAWKIHKRAIQKLRKRLSRGSSGGRA